MSGNLRANGESARSFTATSNTSDGVNRKSNSSGLVIVLLCCAVSSGAKWIARIGSTATELSDPLRLVPQIAWAAVLAMVVIYVTINVDRLPLSSIGIRRVARWDLLLSVLVAFAGVILETLLEPAVARSGLTMFRVRTWDSPPVVDWLSILAAAFGEELVFRGYLIERTETLGIGTKVRSHYLPCSLDFGTCPCGGRGQWLCREPGASWQVHFTCGAAI